MKKLTEKDAIWCKTQKQWDSIIEMFDLDIGCVKFSKFGFCTLFPKDKRSTSSLEWAKIKNYNIHKAKDILKKSKIKELEKRVSKLEKFASDNTTIGLHQPEIISTEPLKFDLPTKELEEKTDKWFLIVDSENREILEDHFNEKLKIGECVISDNYAVFHSVIVVPKYYTEITFDQFKKWVLKEEEKPLSIREVQVKVSNQEEANECSEIAKACGEELLANYYNPESDYMYFRKHRDIDTFGIYAENNNYKEISLQELRERFGKKQETEIDWSKAGQLVESHDYIVAIIKDLNHNDLFTGIILKCKFTSVFSVFDSAKFSKSYFKLCTEPITLKNE